MIFKCKKCGYESEHSYHTIKSDKKTYFESMNIPEIYKGYFCIPYCEKCGEIIDYLDLDQYSFWRWLEHIDNEKADRKLKGKAIIRYFHLDELLNKNIGD